MTAAGPAVALQGRAKTKAWHARQRIAQWQGLGSALLVLGAITLLPTLTLLTASLTPLSLLDPVGTFRFEAPAGNYRQLMHDPRFIGSLWVQLRLSAASVTLQLAVGLALALLLNANGRVFAWARSALLVPMVLPPIVVALIWKILYTPETSPVHRGLEALGWPVRSLIANPDTALWAITIAETWQWFPFTMLMVLAALQTLPNEPLEAARIDGAGRWQLLRYIVLPWLRPVLVVCALFRLIDSFKAFPLIFVLTNGGPGTVTEVTNFYGFIQAFNFSYWGYASAIAVLMLAGVIVLSLIIGRLDRSKADAGH